MLKLPPHRGGRFDFVMKTPNCRGEHRHGSAFVGVGVQHAPTKAMAPHRKALHRKALSKPLLRCDRARLFRRLETRVPYPVRPSVEYPAARQNRRALENGKTLLQPLSG